jgi:hypothetical protein
MVGIIPLLMMQNQNNTPEGPKEEDYATAREIAKHMLPHLEMAENGNSLSQHRVWIDACAILSLEQVYTIQDCICLTRNECERVAKIIAPFEEEVADQRAQNEKAETMTFLIGAGVLILLVAAVAAIIGLAS